MDLEEWEQILLRVADTLCLWHSVKLAMSSPSTNVAQDQQAPYLTSVVHLLAALRAAPQQQADQLDGLVRGLVSPTELALLLYYARDKPESELTKLLLNAGPVGDLHDNWLIEPADRSDTLSVVFPPVDV